MHSLINRQGLVAADPWVLAQGDDGALAPQAWRLVPVTTWVQSREVLFYLAHCGFDSFELREGEDPVASMAELAAFDTVYQAASDRTGPLDHACPVEPACAR
jgi:uncharacterized protein (DUF934 family)